MNNDVDLLSYLVNFKCCVSSRIFAFASLMIDTMLTMETNKEAKETSSEKATVINSEWIRPILPLLSAFVDVEMFILRRSEENSAAPSFTGKKKVRSSSVEFSSYDLSAISMPVDIEMGSNDYIEACISKLVKIIQEINELCSNMSSLQSHGLGKEGAENNENGNKDSILTKILLTLHAMGSTIDGHSLREVCTEVSLRYFSYTLHKIYSFFFSFSQNLLVDGFITLPSIPLPTLPSIQLPF